MIQIINDIHKDLNKERDPIQSPEWEANSRGKTVTKTDEGIRIMGTEVINQKKIFIKNIRI